MEKLANLHPWADEILQALSAHEEAAEIVLGGYFALQHFLDYRLTNDIDAGWRGRAKERTTAAIREVLEQFAARHDCELRERRFGETLSFELVRDNTKRFSFQIAVRSQELQPPILIESLRDNVGAKMNALVNRGAPRDFVDVRHIVGNELVSGEECWDLWSQENEFASVEPAKQKVLAHLSALTMRRPLDSSTDAAKREQAREIREWFKNEFLKT